MTSQRERRLAEWVEEVTGRPVVRVERQSRWRPCWWIELSGDEPHSRLYFRGNREGMGSANDVFREAAAAQAMTAAGIPVAQVHGESRELDGVLWEALSGVDNASVPDAEKLAAGEAYAEVLARLHRADPEPFVGPDRPLPVGPRAVVYADHDFWVSHWRASQPRSEALIHFVERWLERTMPLHRSRPHPLVGDAGQFMWDEGRLSGLIDLEMCHLGDPHHDLAFVRQRDFTESLGGVAAIFRRWADVSELGLDHQLLRWFGVMAAIETPQALSFAVTMALPPGDLAQYLTWYVQLQRCAIEILAEHDGIELDGFERLDHTSRLAGDQCADAAWTAVEGWAADLGSWPFGEPVDGVETDSAEALRHKRGAVGLLGWQRRRAVLGDLVSAAERADQAELLDLRSNGRDDANTALIGVADSPSAPVEALTRLFHRQIVRQEWVMEPVLGDAAGNRLSPLV